MTEALHNILLLVKKPVETFNELKYRRYRHWGLIALTLAAWLIVDIMVKQLYGFRFNTNHADELNILIELSMTIGLFFLFCISNWAICTLSSGEGRFDEICTFCVYAMIPYIVFRFVSILLSRVLTFNEEVFLNWFVWIGMLWSAMLLFQAIRIVHQYSGGRTLFSIFLTLVGICVILFILLLLVALFQQLYSFISMIVSELWIRK